MSNVTSLELSKELYRISGGWGSEQQYFYHPDTGQVIIPRTSYETQVAVIPAYDLDYLLTKLPQRLNYTSLLLRHNKDNWFCGYDRDNSSRGDTPCNAVAKLCIELFKNGILTREKE